MSKEDLAVRECRELINTFFPSDTANPVKVNPRSWRFGLACFARGREIGRKEGVAAGWEKAEKGVK